MKKPILFTLKSPPVQSYSTKIFLICRYYSMSYLKKIIYGFLITFTFALLNEATGQVVQEWVATYNGTGNHIDVGNSSAVDGLGNVYVTGQSVGSGTNYDFTTIKYNSLGVQQWVQRYNGPGNNSDQAYAISIDTQGNIYVTGNSWSTSTSNDYATIKYNSSGVQQWVQRYNGPGNNSDAAYSISMDAQDNVYVTGVSEGVSTNSDYATIKYNSSGVLQWVQRYNGPGNGADFAKSISIDAQGNVFVTGYSWSNSSFLDYATIKYNSSGVQQWVQRYNGSGNGNDDSRQLTIDESGNIYVTGYSLGSGTGYDYVTIKYNTSGVQQWVQRYNGLGNGSDIAIAAFIDGQNNIYVTGWSNGNNTGDDYATIKYNSSGVQQWIQRYNGPGNDSDYAKGISIDAQGNVYVTGYSIGNGTGSDYATIKYNSSGVLQWVQRYNGLVNGYDLANSISVDAQGNVYVTGKSYGIGTREDYTTIKYQQILSINTPSIHLSPIQVNPGGSVNITGQNFRSNTQAKVSVTSSNSQLVHDQVYTTTPTGGFSAGYSSSINSTPGIYTVSCRDIFTNQSAPNKIFEIRQPIENYNISIVSPQSNFPIPDSVDKVINIEWKDKMIPGNGYNIMGSKRHYKYLINYSTDNGNTWEPDSIIKEGYDFINTVSLFNKRIDLDSLINSRSGLNVKLRVTDLININRVANTASLPVRLNNLTRADVKLIWDYSYLERKGSPVGACADGVSRFYIKVSKKPGHTITGVSLYLSDNKGSSSNRILGKLMEANDTAAYSDEALLANSTYSEDLSTKNDYWFWYVSPDDFVRDNDDDTTELRQVKINITVYYMDELPESNTKTVNIIRPPLVLVHGLAGNIDMWNKYKKSMANMFFLEIETPKIETHIGFKENGRFLLNQNQQFNFENEKSLPGIIMKARKSGYACNQVYYVCHSMGGSIMRAASELVYYNSKFNYFKGFVNRLITLDTPHEGSPFADFMVNLHQRFNLPFLRTLREKNNNALLNSAFVVNSDNSLSLSNSILDLQSVGNEKYKFKQTNIRSFLIAGDFMPGLTNLENINWNFSYSEELEKTLNIFDLILPFTSIPPLLNLLYKPSDYIKAWSLTHNPSRIKIERVFKLTDLIYNKFLNSESFFPNSDLIVSINSQLAGFNPQYSFNAFDKFDTSNPNSLGIGHTHFNECYESSEIKNKVIELLNLPGNSPQFLPFIPATPNSNLLSSSISNFQPRQLDTANSLNIITPNNGQILFVDSTLNVSFTLSDTNNLKYVNVSFQGDNYYDTIKSFSYNFYIAVNGSEMDSSILNIFAVYSFNDTINFSNDYRKVFVKTNASALEISVSNDVFQMMQNDIIQPQYKIIFPNFIYEGNMKDISASIENPSIISFNSTEKSFKALSSGGTSAIISIGNARDTIYFNVMTDIQLPGITNLYYPSDSAIVSSSNLRFNWSIVDYAAYYNFQIAEDINFENIVFEDNKLSDTMILIPSIEDSTAYYWRVKGINSAGSGNWSLVRNFTVLQVEESYLVITMIPEGFYNQTINQLQRRDTLKVYLANSISPFNIIDSSSSVIDSISFKGSFKFVNAHTGTYYLVLKHRNSIETWSLMGIPFIQGDTMNYDFSSAAAQAFGSNMKQISAVPLRFAVYSGDVNQDRIIDASDLSMVDNDAFNSQSGYRVTDVNGDDFVDASDLSIVDNNTFIGVIVMRPGGLDKLDSKSEMPDVRR